MSWAVATVAAAGLEAFSERPIRTENTNRNEKKKIGVGGWVGNEINARMENASERKQNDSLKP